MVTPDQTLLPTKVKPKGVPITPNTVRNQVLAVLKFCPLDQFEFTAYDFFIKKHEMLCPKCFEKGTFHSCGRGGNTKSIGIRSYQFKCSTCQRKSQLPAILKENKREDIL